MNLKHCRGSDLGSFHHLKTSPCRKWQVVQDKTWAYYVACHTAVTTLGTELAMVKWHGLLLNFFFLTSSLVEEDGEIREGEGWFPGQEAACVTACGVWWGCRGSGFLATPKCRDNKTRFINLAGARKVMTGSSAHWRNLQEFGLCRNLRCFRCRDVAKSLCKGAF